MRKKVTLILVSLILVLCSLSLLVACNHTHTFGDWTITVTPEANKQGVAERVCTDCGEKESVSIPSLTDDKVWTVNIVDATESADGKEIYTSEYGTVEIKIPATGHIWRELVSDEYLASAATCTESATYYKSCACGEKSSEVFSHGDPLDHDFSELHAKVDANCIADGHVEYKTCSRCEKNFSADGKELDSIVIATDSSAHSFGTWVDEVSATCSAEGVKAHKDCTLCGKYFDNDGIEIVDLVIAKNASAHSFGAWVDEVSSSCSKEGVKGHKDCSLCGKHFDADNVEIADLSIAKLNHTFAEIVSDDTLSSGANCQSPAVYYKSCSVCHVKSEETFTCGEIGTHTDENGVCTICNKIKVAIDKNDGSDATIFHVEANSLLDEALLSAPTLENNRFLGWLVEGNAFAANTPITSSITIKAGWADYSGFANKNYRYAYTTNGGVALNYSTVDYNIATNDEGIAIVVGGNTSAPVYPGSTLSFAWLDKAKGLAYIVESYSYTSDSSSDDDDEGWGSSSSSTTSGVRYYLALVDSESGIILRAQYSLTEMPDATASFKVGASAFMLVPTEANVEAVSSDDYKGSKLDSQAGWIFVISYKGTTIYISDNNVYFGVSVCDLSGNALSADSVNNSDSVIISKGDEVIARFGKVEKKFASLDQYAGYYTQGDNTLVVSGLGTFVLGDKIGNYTVALGDYTLDAYVVVDGVNVEYAQITLNGASYTIVYPTARIIFVSNEDGTTAPDAGDYNINIVPSLPVMDNTMTKTFKGWALADGTIVSSSYVVTEDITVTAVWADKVVVNIINSYGNVSVIYLGEGDAIGDYLEACIGESDEYYFIGWYIDMNANGMIDEGDIIVDDEAIISAEDTGLTVIAKWERIPAYVGSYTGSFLRNAGYCYGSSKSLTISVNGEISGTYSGNVVSYADGKLLWIDSSSKQHTFLFDEGGEIIVYLISESGYDYAVFGKDLAKDGKVTLQKGVNAPLQGNESTVKNCAQFITMTTAYGENTTIFYYGDILLVNAVFKNAKGEELSVSDVPDSDSVVVYNGSGDKVFALVAPKTVASLAKTDTYGAKAPMIPDEFFGIYSLDGESALVIKGNGVFVWGDKSGNYTAIDDSSVEAYVVVDDVNTEYYIFTLSDGGFTYNKVSVNVSFSSSVVPDDGVPSDIQANKNVNTVLPVLTADNHVFRGWKLEGDDTIYTEYTFTEDVSLIAYWDVEVTLTVVYGNGLDTVVLYYGAGDTTAPVEPELENGKVFDYWYLSNDDGATVSEEYTPSVITENTVIYVAWTNPPIYMGSYYGARFYGYSTSPNTLSGSALTFDRKGIATPDGTVFASYSSYKNATVKLNVLDSDSGKISLVYSYESSSELTTKTHYGYIDFESGIIVINTSSDSESYTSVWFLIPSESRFTNSNFKTLAAWNSNKTKPILYVNGDEEYGIFYNNDVVYMNVSFYNQSNEKFDFSTTGLTRLTVKDADGDIIAEYGYDGSKFVDLDGYHGTYTGTIDGANHSIEFNGVGSFTCDDCSLHGTYAKAGDTFDVYTLDDNSNKVNYYVFTLDGSSFTAEKPMVNVSFETDYDNAVGGSFNKNIKIELPSGLVDDTHYFMGWFVQGDESETFVSEYTPISDITFVAKWLDKVSLTIVYGNEISSETHVFYAGAHVSLDDYKIMYANGKLFQGWFADEALETSVDMTTIDSDTTIYAKYVEHEPYTITDSSTYPWDRTGDVWTSGNYNKSSSESTITIEVYTEMVISFQYACESEKATQWDYFSISINGSTKATAGGSDNGIDYFFSYSETLNAGDVIVLKYQKDSSTNTGADMAIIKNFLIYEANHTHNYEAVVADGFIATAATCSAYATYYKSCSICHKAGTDTFSGTEYGPHSYVDHVCTVCNGDQPYYVVTVMTNNGDAQSYNAYEGIINIDDLNAFITDKDGYYFDGWYLDSAFTSVLGDTVDSNTTVYAKWSVNLSLSGLVFTGKYYNSYDEADHNLTLTFGDDDTAVLWEGGSSWYFNTTCVVNGTDMVFTITSAISGRSDIGKTFLGSISGNTITFAKGTFFSSNVYTFYNGATVSCENFVAPHSCVFSEEVVADKYLANSATCISKATYYKSCPDCGAMGSETFEVGEYGSHNYVEGFCSVCNEPKPKDIYQITFVLGNGEDDIIVNAIEAEAIGDLLPASPTRGGHSFIGWFIGDVEVTADYIVTGTATVNASWRESYPFENNEYRIISILAYSSPGVSYTGDVYKIQTNSQGIASVVGDSTSAPIYPGSTLTISWIDEDNFTVLIKEDYSYTSSSSWSWGGSSVTSGTRYYWGVLESDSGIIFRGYVSYTTEASAISALNSATDFGSTVYAFIPSTSEITSSVVSGKRLSTLNGKEWMFSYNNGTTTTNFFMSEAKVYANVSFTDAGGNSLVVGDACNNSSTVYISKNGETLFTYGKNSNAKFVILDGYQGEYTGDNGTLTIDGINSASFESESGTYTATENDNEFEVYFKDSDGNNVKYAVITLDKENGTYTMVVPSVSVSYVTDYDSVENISTNKNIGITLPGDLTCDTHVFRGWYVQGDASKTLISSPYTPTEDVVFVAKWDAKVTLTVVYGNGLDNVVLDYAVGDTVAPVAPDYKDGKAFDHWYLSTDNGETENSVYTPGVISENMTIYCDWKDASPLMGTYKGFEAWNQSVGKGNLSSRSDLVIDADGKVTSGPGINGKTATDYDETTGILYFGNYWAYYDSDNGILIYNYSSGGSEMKNDLYVMFKGVDSVTDDGASVSNTMQFVWGSGLNRLIDVTVTKGDISETFILYIADNKAQKVTIVTDVESIVTATALYASSTITVNTLKVYDLEGNLLGDFAKSGDGTSMLPLDGTQGTYTLDGAQDLILSGTGTAKIGENTGSVTLSAEGSSYTYDMYMTESGSKVYYELTIDVDTKTYSINKPMVNVSFDLDGKGTMDDISVNKNVEFSLSSYAPTYDGFNFKGWYNSSALTSSITAVTPTEDVTVYAKWVEVYTLTFETAYGETPESRTYESGENCYYGHRPTLKADGYIYRGWYLKDDETQTLITSYFAVTSNVTLVAKWEEALTITIVYVKDGYENKVVYVGSGDTFSLTSYKPEQAEDGEVFDNWYTDSTLTTAFSATSITESTTIYCGWKEPCIYMGTYKGANFYSTSTENKTSLSSTLTIDASENVVGRGSGILVENGDSYTYGTSGTRNFDIDNGVCYEDYSTGNTLGYYDIYIYFIVKYDSEGKEITPTSAQGSVWDSRTVKLITCTYSDDSTNTALYYKGLIYGNVTFDAVDSDNNAIIDPSEVYNTASNVKVYDSNGVLICEYAMDGGSLVEVANE